MARTTPPPPTWSIEEQVAAGVVFAGDPQPATSLGFEPESSEVEAFSRAVRAVSQAADIVTKAYRERPEIRAIFGYDPLREAAASKHPGYPWLVPLGRMDCFRTLEGPQVLEFNTDGAAAWHWASALVRLSRLHSGLPAGRPTLVQALAATLRACHSRWPGRCEANPRVAIVDWTTVRSRSDQEGLATTFLSLGLQATRVDPRALRLEGGRLFGPEGRIDLVYRRLVSEEAFARRDDVKVVIDAWLGDAACFVGGFCTDPAWTKTFLAIASDPSFDNLFPADLREDLGRCLPWTRILRRGPADSAGTGPDLEHLLLEDPAGFILKPGRAYEGRGVLAGAIAPIEAWKAAVTRALDEGGWVVQRFLKPLPLCISGCGRFVQQIGAFVLLGRLAGFHARYSLGELLAPWRREWCGPADVEIGWTPPDSAVET